MKNRYVIYIRPVTEADLPGLARIFLEARIQAFHWCDPATFQLSDFAPQTEGEIIHVATDDHGAILGFISIWETDNFIHHLFIDPAHQRQGIGTELLQSLHTWLPYPHRLKCLLQNTPARAFYLRAGWKDVSSGSDALGDYAVMEFDSQTPAPLTYGEESPTSNEEKLNSKG